MSGHLAWTVFVDREHENVWRAALGQADIDGWCAAHGWSSKSIKSGSGTVFGYRDGHAEVVADVLIRDAEGRAQLDPHQQDAVLCRTETRLLARSLPEGVGQVIR